MVSRKTVIQQLKKIDFNYKGWGRGEISELPHIIIPGEVIYECVNGIYEGGFALLVATDIRLLLIDKKPLNYLTVEDLRFDMISEMDYNHRIIGADISISSGSKSLRFRSYNQPRLRKLIGHVQHCMAEIKKKQTSHQDTQVSHLEQINRQLQTYLVAQQQYQIQMQQMSNQQSGSDTTDAQVPTPPKPSNELADYLYAQSLLSEYQQTHSMKLNSDPKVPAFSLDASSSAQDNKKSAEQSPPAFQNEIEADSSAIYKEGMKEVFGNQTGATTQQSPQDDKQDDVKTETITGLDSSDSQAIKNSSHRIFNFDINPMYIAYSKLPMLLRNRKLMTFHRNRDMTANPNTTPEPHPSRA